MPALGLGTWELLPPRKCRKAVADALAMGYRHLDTAVIYENEEAVGQGIADSGVPRDEIFLTTKVWRDDLRRDDAITSAEASLRRLGTDHVDLLLIHWPHDTIPLEETLEAFVQLREQGKTRHLGVSNFPPSLLSRALELAPIFCNQVEYHPFLTHEPLRDLAREHDVLLTAYSPLAKGRVTKERVLREIGRHYGKSAAQVTLRWLLQQGMAVIPKAAKKRHRRANLKVFDFELSAREMAIIEDLDRNERLIDAPFVRDWERPA